MHEYFLMFRAYQLERQHYVQCGAVRAACTLLDLNDSWAHGAGDGEWGKGVHVMLFGVVAALWEHACCFAVCGASAWKKCDQDPIHLRSRNRSWLQHPVLDACVPQPCGGGCHWRPPDRLPPRMVGIDATACHLYVGHPHLRRRAFTHTHLFPPVTTSLLGSACLALPPPSSTSPHHHTPH